MESDQPAGRGDGPTGLCGSLPGLGHWRAVYQGPAAAATSYLRLSGSYDTNLCSGFRRSGVGQSRGPKSRCWQNVLEAPGGTPFLCLRPLPLSTRPGRLLLRVVFLLCPSCEDTRDCSKDPLDETGKSQIQPMQCPFFRRVSHSQVPGLRTGTSVGVVVQLIWDRQPQW